MSFSFWRRADVPFPTRAAFGACSETLLVLGDAGLPPRPAQGLTPPLHPRKGFHPLTRFRFAIPC